jgi:hypothetical protein
MATVGEKASHRPLLQIGGIKTCFELNHKYFRWSDVNLVRERRAIIVVDVIESDGQCQRLPCVTKITRRDRSGQMIVRDAKAQLQRANDTGLAGIVRPHKDQMLAHVNPAVG